MVTAFPAPVTSTLVAPVSLSVIEKLVFPDWFAVKVCAVPLTVMVNVPLLTVGSSSTITTFFKFVPSQ